MFDKKAGQVMSIYLKGIDQSHVFHPGDTIVGVVEITPNEVIKCRQVEVTIGWHTEGRGDLDRMIIYNDMIPVEEIYPDSPITHHFETVLPSEPWSYAGKLIRIVWEVQAKIDIAWATDINQSLQFALAPAPEN